MFVISKLDMPTVLAVAALELLDEISSLSFAA